MLDELLVTNEGELNDGCDHPVLSAVMAMMRERQAEVAAGYTIVAAYEDSP